MSEGEGTATDGGLGAFIAQQARGLGPFDYLVVSASDPPHDAARVLRSGDGSWDVAVWNRAEPPLSDTQRAALGTLGFTETPAEWRTTTRPTGQEEAFALLNRVLADVCGVPPGGMVDIKHDSSAAEEAAAAAVAALRERLVLALSSRLGHPPPTDDDGDFVVDLSGVRMYVSAQNEPGRSAIVQVFTITNVGVPVTDALGAYLASANFGLIFGRFSLDAERGAVWLTENLLGRHLQDDDLWEIIDALASTVAFFDERIARRFGGSTGRAAQAAHPEDGPEAPNKPGQGGYL